MDCLETVLLRKAGLRMDMFMLSSAPGGWHCQHMQSPQTTSSTEEEAPGDTDRGGLLWEDFSVDDLLDLGGGKEQHGAEGEAFLQVGEAQGEGQQGEERGSSSSSNTSSSASALSFQAALPPTTTSDPIVPAVDVEDLEWVSRFVDDSYSEFASSAIAPPLPNLHAPALPAAKTEALKARSTSPTTPSKRSWRSCSFSAESLVVPGKARSKRSRTVGRVWSLRGPSLLREPSSSCCSSASSSSSCSVFSSVTSTLGGAGGNPVRFPHCPGGGPPFDQPQLPQLQLKKKKGRKPKVPADAAAVGGGSGGGPEQQARRRCSHCGVDKTPQWRAGPMGAKTLCNACGVRYKSGRLLPEYRPAGSPTFLSHVHSNSHRRVLELRRSKELLDAGGPATCSPSPLQLVGATRPYGVV